MPPSHQIRLFIPHPENDSTRLLLTQSVSIVVVSPPQQIHFPIPPRTTLLLDVPLSSLLDPAFLTANVLSKDTSPSTNLVATLAQNRPSHSICATIAANSLIVTAPHPAVSSLGLTVTKPPRHTRTHDLPPAICVPLSKSNSHKRARWALSAERLGKCDVRLSCGRALVKPPAGPTATSGPVHRSDSTWRADYIADACAALQSSEEGVAHAFLEHAQALAVGLNVDCDDGGVDGFGEALPCLAGGRNVRRVQYMGLCNTGLAEEAVGAAKKAVGDGAAWAMVLARAPPGNAVWKGCLPRGGEAGFSLDAAELFVVTSKGVYVAQLRAPCDAT